MPTSSSAVALTDPTVATVSPNRAGYRHPGVRRARTVSASNQGSPVNARRITEMRAESVSTYGERP